MLAKFGTDSMDCCKRENLQKTPVFRGKKSMVSVDIPLNQPNDSYDLHPTTSFEASPWIPMVAPEICMAYAGPWRHP